MEHIVKFWYLNLFEPDIIMQDYYSLLGKPATCFSSCLLCSYLLSIKLKVSSITKWCSLFKTTPLYAILNSFSLMTLLVAISFTISLTVFGSLTKTTVSVRSNTKDQKREKKKHGDKTLCGTNSAISKPSPSATLPPVE